MALFVFSFLVASRMRHNGSLPVRLIHVLPERELTNEHMLSGLTEHRTLLLRLSHSRISFLWLLECFRRVAATGEQWQSIHLRRWEQENGNLHKSFTYCSLEVSVGGGWVREGRASTRQSRLFAIDRLETLKFSNFLRPHERRRVV